MEFTGNIDNSEVRDIVQDELDNLNFVDEDDLEGKLDAIDERIAAGVVTESDFDGLVRRIVVLEEALTTAQRFFHAVIIGTQQTPLDDAPEA